MQGKGAADPVLGPGGSACPPPPAWHPLPTVRGAAASPLPPTGARALPMASLASAPHSLTPSPCPLPQLGARRPRSFYLPKQQGPQSCIQLRPPQPLFPEWGYRGPGRACAGSSGRTAQGLLWWEGKAPTGGAPPEEQEGEASPDHPIRVSHPCHHTTWHTHHMPAPSHTLTHS